MVAGVFLLVSEGIVVRVGAQAPVVLVAHPVFPGGDGTPLGTRIAALLAEPGVARAHWGVAVTALDGTPIWGLDERKMFRPASNAKLFTTAAAMALLGPKRVLHTEVWGYAPDAEGVVAGDVTLYGGGDPAFGTFDIPYLAPAQRKAKGVPAVQPDPLQDIDELAAQLAAHGVKLISGGIVGKDTLWVWEPYPDTWGIDDLTSSDGAPVSALTVNDNTVVLKVQPGAKAGDDAIAILSPQGSGYTLDVDVKTVAAHETAAIGVDRAVGSKIVRVFGTVAVGQPRTREMAVDEPALFAATALRDRLIAHGVTVDGVATAQHLLAEDTKGFTVESREPMTQAMLQSRNGWSSSNSCDRIVKPGDVVELVEPCKFPVKLAEHVSAPLVDDVTFTLKASQNLHAEMMLRELGHERGEITLPLISTASTTAQGARVERQFLLNAGIDGDDFLFYDGSGLSSHDLVTPRATAQLLSFATKQPWFAAWKAALPVGGEDGTLASRFPDAPLKDHVFAKTGTLGESRGLSGYVDCASGRQVIFSIFVDEHTPVGSADRVTMDKIVAAIAAEN
jgi:serine-type D-Ala-D-Ala carboxypeptidase/endopeptidase (penicillin-binding protein 4)